MFSIARFNGHGASPSSAGRDESQGQQDAQQQPSKLDRRIALLNQRKAQAQAATSTTEQNGVQQIDTDSQITAVASASGGLNIHPSRLAASHVLRQADRKARSLASGTAKDKTRAKQRYLNRKKDRRKKRKAAAVASAPKSKKDDGIKNAIASVSDAVNVDQSSSGASSSSSSDSDSDSDSEDGNVEGKREEATTGLGALDVQPTDDTVMQDIEDDEVDNDDAEEPAKTVQEDASQPAALFRLPAPRTTSQVSRRDLAAQGLPQGLANPLVIDAAQTATVVSGDAKRPLDYVSQSTKDRLAKLGIVQWFAVQTAVVPALLDHPLAFDLYPSPAPGDLCVSSPTGSGKTLSYVVPIVEVLRRRICRRVRALIVLPTRDLVHQVRETIEAVASGGTSDLTVASLTGQQSFAHEQSMLVDAPDVLLTHSVPGVRAPVRGSEEEKRLIEQQFQAVYGDTGDKNEDRRRGTKIESKVDIVIATPGRLMDHIEQTPGFTLQHLRFLVIDEADRLLSQSFQEWLPRILQSLDPAHNDDNAVAASSKAPLTNDSALHPAWLREKQLGKADVSAIDQEVLTKYGERQSTVQKLLFSATLTRDPAKIVALQLRNATFISVEEKKAKKQSGDDGSGEDEEEQKDWQDSFALPSTLKEHMLVATTATKPLYLLHLLYTYEEPLRHVLCFTKSVESATRLVKLLELFDVEWRRLNRKQKQTGNAPSSKDRGGDGLVVREHSSDLRGAQRAQLLKDVNLGAVDVVVCSDVIARGIDINDVRHVVSYDAPVEMAKYVHRVGRTARAGRKGDAWTLVEEQEARHFTHMIRRAGRWSSHMDKIRLAKGLRVRLQDVENGVLDQQQQSSDEYRSFDTLIAAYQVALGKLEEHFSTSVTRRQRT